MAAEQVFDPNLGEERDAFPGEVVPPEQEKTLQKLMRAEEERFTSDLAKVVATGKLPPSDEDAVRRFAKLRAEIIRQQYLEALNSNPANILQNTLRELAIGEGNVFVKNSLISLNNNISRLQKNIAIEKSSDKMSGKSQNAEQNVKSYLAKNVVVGNTLNTLIDVNAANAANVTFPSQRKILEANAFELIKKLGFLPVDTLGSFSDVYKAVSAISNPQNRSSDNKPYTDQFSINNLSSNVPGLEGISASIFFNDGRGIDVRGFRIFGTPQALARIVDKGQYVPYESSKT